MKRTTISTELSEQYSTSDTSTETTDDSKTIETSQVHTLCNKSTHDEAVSPTMKSVNEFELPKENGEQYIGKEDKLLTTLTDTFLPVLSRTLTSAPAKPPLAPLSTKDP